MRESEREREREREREGGEEGERKREREDIPKINQSQRQPHCHLLVAI